MWYRKLWISLLALPATLVLANAQSAVLAQSAYNFNAPGPGGAAGNSSFLQSQLSYRMVSFAFQNKDALLRAEFEKKGLTWPAKYIYIRSFKYDSQLEVWVKNSISDTFRLFKTYRICALSGSLGPKRRAGDRQVPEGFYYINEYRPNSQYHLALGLNYPNFSDQVKGNTDKLGGDIYIHGSCVTEGCIPLTDPQIEELYVLAVHARDLGQDYIPVHIFPVRFDNRRSMDFLDKSNSGDTHTQLWKSLKDAYEYFNDTHEIPLILYNVKGAYVVKEEEFTPSSPIAR